MPYSTLHGEAASTFEKIYNAALDTYKGDKEKAARTAWAGLKKAGYKKSEDGQWHKSVFAEFSMSITKASYDTRSGGAMRFRAVASDTDPDLYEEKMSTELFTDFVNRIENNTPIPESFKSAVCEDTWCGGMPYPSISHFRSGPQGVNVPGKLDKVYSDGNVLKSVGILYDTELGRAVFKSLCDDLYAKKSEPDHNPVRISIGFLDLQHSHIGNGMNYKFERKGLTDQCPMCFQNIGGKVYEKGILVHLAFTRVPVNPRTEAEVERSMSDAIVTKKDDAASIVGELADVLVDKSKAEEVLVVKAQEGEGKTLKMPDASLYQDCYDPNTGLFKQECIDAAMMGHMPAMRKAMSANKINEGGHEEAANDVPGKWLALTKKQRDGEHPVSHYLVVGDVTNPATWHLPVKDVTGRINKHLLKAVHAALSDGRYAGSDSGEALVKLRSLYTLTGLSWPGNISEKEKAMTADIVDKGKIPTAPVPGNPDMIDIFDDDELYPAVPSNKETIDPSDTSGMGAPAGTVTEIKKAKPFAGKEDAEEEEAEKKGKKPPFGEKALVSTAKSLISQVVALKSQGVYGDPALQALQPYMNQFGEAIRRSVSGGGDSELAAELVAVRQELATLRAQVAAANAGEVTRSAVPAPRNLRFNPATMAVMQEQAGGQLGGLTTQKTPFTQISAIARKSVGLP